MATRTRTACCCYRRQRARRRRRRSQRTCGRGTCAWDPRGRDRVQPRHTDAAGPWFDEPGKQCRRILTVMAETRLVLANDDGVRAVYAAHGPELYRFALRSLGDRGLAEEAVQETFVRAWQAADRFDESLGSLRTWLFAIIRNVVIDMSRARAVRPGLAGGVSGSDEIVLDDDIDRVLVAWQV